MSPAFHKRGAAYRINPKPQDPNGEYAKTLRAKLQRKLEALTKPPQPVTTLAEMSPEKQAEMRRLYNKPVGNRKTTETVLMPDDLHAEYVVEGAQSWRPKPLKAVTEDDVHGA